MPVRALSLRTELFELVGKINTLQLEAHAKALPEDDAQADQFLDE